MVAVDSARQETFFEAKRLLNSKAEYIVEDVCYLNAARNRVFRYRYCFSASCITSSIPCWLWNAYASSPPAWPVSNPWSPTIRRSRTQFRLLEFYETTELAGQFDNWCGPNTSCLLAYMRTAGFVNARLLGEHDCRAQAVGYRKWPDVARSGEGPQLVCVENTWTRDHNFRSDRDTYFTVWFNTTQTGLDCDNVFVQVGPYACRPVGVRNFACTGWQANCKLALGVSHGWFDVTVAVGDSNWSNASRIPIDLTRTERRSPGPVADWLEIAGVTDGKTYESNRVRIGVESCMSLWAAGLPENATQSDITLRLDGADLPAVYLSGPDDRQLRQINAMLPPQLEAGDYLISVQFRSAESQTAPLHLFKP